MLWYKSWLETRWRFAIGLAILILSASGTVLAYPRVVALLPLVPRPLLSPAVGETFSVVDVLVYGTCAFFAAAVLFSLASLLSTVFSDVWRPALIVCGLAACIGIAEPFFGDYSRYGLFGLMD